MRADPTNPDHYRRHPSGVECITIAEAFGYRLGNVVKYVWRAGLKTTDALPDLKKARWYLDREIAALEARRRSVDMTGREIAPEPPCGAQKPAHGEVAGKRTETASTHEAKKQTFAQCLAYRRADTGTWWCEKCATSAPCTDFDAYREWCESVRRPNLEGG